MPIELNAIEARIVGSLMEKSVVTPDQYPLTLNALVLACNQKSRRDPVMNLEPGEVLNAVRQLESRHLVTSDEHHRGRVERFAQRLCNTRYGELLISPSSRIGLAVGPQWVGGPTPVTVRIPNQLSLVDLEYFAQGFFFDVGNQLPGPRVRMTNGIRGQIGAP